MRRDARRRHETKKWWEDKRIIMSGSVGCLVLAIIIGVALYSNDSRYNQTENQTQIISLTPENDVKEETTSASTSIGKSIEEAQSENTSINDTTALNSTNTDSNNSVRSNTTSNSSKTNTTKKQSKQVNANTQKQNEIVFAWPVKGDILKAFSVDSLLYSSTLQEWTVHNGIDIKADKAQIIGAAADGTVKSIKNDPRYGLTVIIEHEDGFKTVYSNLLTSEFVVEGEKVKQSQTIGTIGNSANFEVADDSHLHFELLKDNEYVDPMLYLN